jgi:hypothetical protein
MVDGEKNRDLFECVIEDILISFGRKMRVL